MARSRIDDPRRLGVANEPPTLVVMARSRIDDPHRLDVVALAAAAGELSGTWPLASLARLAESTLSPAEGGVAADVDWTVRGALLPLAGAGVRPSLRIDAAADVTLVCQRCLQSLEQSLRAGRRIAFVDSEEQAAALDAEHDDDVLALAPVLDLAPLIEDELLLALPLVPRHDVCSEPLPRPLVDTGPQPGAFAALAALKTVRKAE